MSVLTLTTQVAKSVSDWSGKMSFDSRQILALHFTTGPLLLARTEHTHINTHMSLIAKSCTSALSRLRRLAPLLVRQRVSQPQRWWSTARSVRARSATAWAATSASTVRVPALQSPCASAPGYELTSAPFAVVATWTLSGALAMRAGAMRGGQKTEMCCYCAHHCGWSGFFRSACASCRMRAQQVKRLVHLRRELRDCPRA